MDSALSWIGLKRMLRESEWLGLLQSVSEVKAGAED